MSKQLPMQAGMIARLVMSLSIAALCFTGLAAAQTPYQHVLFISIDGMHALDLANCSTGIASINGGAPYCPNLARLTQTGLNYVAASTSKPSDSFPGLLAEITGGSPRSTGVFYDVSYDRALSPPTQTTPGLSS